MKLLKTVLGWGVVIYAVMYLLWSGLVIYGFAAGYSSLVLRLIALAAVTIIAGRSLHLSNRMDLIPYAIGWAIVAIALDTIFLVPFSGWVLFASWSVWVGYALIAVLPTVFVFLNVRKHPQTQ
jgi:hypothetical protein